MQQPIAVSINEACKMLSVGRTSLYDLINAGRVQRVKLGKRTLIRVSSLHSLMDDLAI